MERPTGTLLPTEDGAAQGGYEEVPWDQLVFSKWELCPERLWKPPPDNRGAKLNICSQGVCGEVGVRRQPAAGIHIPA